MTTVDAGIGASIRQASTSMQMKYYFSVPVVYALLPLSRLCLLLPLTLGPICPQKSTPLSCECLISSEHQSTPNISLAPQRCLWYKSRHNKGINNWHTETRIITIIPVEMPWYSFFKFKERGLGGGTTKKKKKPRRCLKSVLLAWREMKEEENKNTKQKESPRGYSEVSFFFFLNPNWDQIRIA